MLGEPSGERMAVVDAVGAVVVEAAGRVLLVRRRNEPYAGEWSLPGGKVEPGETLTEAVHREVLEETGLAVRVVRLLETYELTGAAGGYLIFEYLCVPVDDAAAASPLEAADDASAAAWATLDEASAWGLREGAMAVIRRALQPVEAPDVV